MSEIETIENLIVTLKEDMEKFEGGNNSAGTRARKALQEIKKVAQELRLNIQAAKNAKSE